ncbi:HRDC domain-containing protein [Accumulibacter sp.]|uniref:HRDC domain-containing protein n=1 Tax=Accumulibacter sp. TaxID=2053492 RepID=UPI0026277384|nr:HRDC domain-containing protein [Accumulibacter sp.]
MKFHVFTIDVQQPEAGQEALNVFCAQHRVVDVEKRFVDQGRHSFWAFCVVTLDGDAPSRPAGDRKRVDYREILGEADFSLFADLRNLRKSLAEREGVPPYALFTNEQLAAMVTRRVTTRSALDEIEGVGEARAQKYAPHFLPRLRQAFSEAGAVDAADAN